MIIITDLNNIVVEVALIRGCHIINENFHVYEDYNTYEKNITVGDSYNPKIDNVNIFQEQ